MPTAMADSAMAWKKTSTIGGAANNAMQAAWTSSDGAVVFATGPGNYATQVHSIDAISGETRWLWKAPDGMVVVNIIGAASGNWLATLRKGGFNGASPSWVGVVELANAASSSPQGQVLGMWPIRGLSDGFCCRYSPTTWSMAPVFRAVSDLNNATDPAVLWATCFCPGGWSLSSYTRFAVLDPTMPARRISNGTALVPQYSNYADNLSCDDNQPCLSEGISFSTDQVTLMSTCACESSSTKYAIAAIAKDSYGITEWFGAFAAPEYNKWVIARVPGWHKGSAPSSGNTAIGCTSDGLIEQPIKTLAARSTLVAAAHLDCGQVIAVRNTPDAEGRIAVWVLAPLDGATNTTSLHRFDIAPANTTAGGGEGAGAAASTTTTVDGLTVTPVWNVTLTGLARGYFTAACALGDDSVVLAFEHSLVVLNAEGSVTPVGPLMLDTVMLQGMVPAQDAIVIVTATSYLSPTLYTVWTWQ